MRKKLLTLALLITAVAPLSAFGATRAYASVYDDPCGPECPGGPAGCKTVVTPTYYIQCFRAQQETCPPHWAPDGNGSCYEVPNG